MFFYQFFYIKNIEKEKEDDIETAPKNIIVHKNDLHFEKFIKFL
jgi:hypothetical protein